MLQKLTTWNKGRKVVQGSWKSDFTFYSHSPEHVSKSYAWGNYKSSLDT